MSAVNKVWVCPENKDHVFEERTPTGACPICDHTFSFLVLEKRKVVDTGEGPEPGGEVKVSPDRSRSHLQEKYSRLVIEATGLFEEEQYAAAKEKYEAALNIFKDRDELHDKIMECEEKLKEVEAEKIGVKEKPVLFPAPPPSSAEGSIALCVLLMDASSSMFSVPAYEGSEENRAQVVARAAARGIMNSKGKTRAQDAYLAVFKFDHRTRPVFVKSIAEINEEFKTAEALEKFFYTSMESDMGGETDINAALQEAYNFVDIFLKKEMVQFRKKWDDKDYPIFISPVSNRKTMDYTEIPNVRVFIYTDGEQFVDDVTKELVNPFQGGGNLPGMPVDVLLGAYIGSGEDEGAEQLKVILSDCPEHDHRQFFLIDKAEGLVELEKIFHMASGNSGFCNLCVEKEQRHTGTTVEEKDTYQFDELL